MVTSGFLKENYNRMRS